MRLHEESSIYSYDKVNKLVALISGKPSANSALVVMGGMTDGLMSLPAMPLLSEKCCSWNLALVQFTMQSSTAGFGLHSLQDDAEDFGKLLKSLKKRFLKVYLLGFSTGCQDILWYLNQNTFIHNGEDDKKVIPHIVGIVLLNGVSDLDYIRNTCPDWRQLLTWANEKCDGDNGDEIYFKLIFGLPMNAYRIRSLLSEEGDDNMFSILLSQDRLKEIFSPLKGVNLLVLFSENDEYVPIKTVYQHLDAAYQAVCGDSYKMTVLEGADHYVTPMTAQSNLLDLLDRFFVER